MMTLLYLVYLDTTLEHAGTIHIRRLFARNANMSFSIAKINLYSDTSFYMCVFSHVNFFHDGNNVYKESSTVSGVSPK